MTRNALAFATLGLLGVLSTGSIAQTVSSAPTLLNYQGRLTTPSGNPIPDGTYSIRYSLWDAVSGGTEKWNQTLASVQVKNGTFAVLLNTNTAGLFNGNLWLETKIGADAALAPRQQLVSVAYAMKANSVPDGSISGASIANNTITANKLSSDALGWLLGGNNITNPATQFFGTTSNQPLAFRTNNTEKMRLLPNGNFGIGTNAPGMTLEAVTSSYYGGPALGASNGVNRWTYLHVGPNDPSFMWNSGSSLRFGVEPSRGSGYVERMRITSSGNVGIGTTSPNNKLEVRNGNVVVTNETGGVRVLNAVNTASDTGYIQIIGGANVVAGLGGTATGGQIFARDGAGSDTILLNGATGEMTAKIVTVTGGSDVAEPYNVASVGGIKPLPGMLVAIDEEKVGQMKVATGAYNTAVAGIISGANGIRPGITLTQKGTVADGELPVASIGRVWCWCNADANGAIKAGDMLTTSETPGHAMKVRDHNRANGSVIGKAMSSLKSGKGLVLVLVSLK